ncbi:MAG: MFS transporter [Rectinemataceae bacterium]|nr:MFS transporter [Rectinemataceae bacterium]
MSPIRGRFRRNAFACLAFLPLWSLSYSLSFFYLSLYFKASGVTDVQLGFLVTAGSGASILFSILAAPLVDRMGRRRSTFVFDLIGSALPFLLYAVGGSFVFALAGTLLANASRVMNVGYYLLMTEDSQNEERTAAFNVFNIIYVASGLLLPLAGGIVARAGILKAERLFLLLSAAAIAVSAFGRFILSSETAAGAAILKKAHGIAGARDSGTGPMASKPLLAGYKEVFSFLSNNREAAAAAAADTLFYVYYVVGTNSSLYFTPFFADALGMGASMAGSIGAIWAGGTLMAMLFLNPPVFRRFGPVGCALIGALLNAAGFIPLLFVGRGSVLAVMAALGVASLGFGMLKSAIDAALAVSFGEGALGDTLTAGEAARSGVYAVVNLGSSILGMGAGALCGLFYTRTPRFIPAFSLLLLTAVGVALGTTHRAANRVVLRRPQSGRARRRS